MTGWKPIEEAEPFEVVHLGGYGSTKDGTGIEWKESAGVAMVERASFAGNTFRLQKCDDMYTHFKALQSPPDMDKANE